MNKTSCCTKRTCAALASLLLLCMLALAAFAAASYKVGVAFTREGSNKDSVVDGGVDSSREATLTRSANGTYTLVLPIKHVSLMGARGHLSGITIGDIDYGGSMSGDLSAGTALLTIPNLPASVLTGADSSRSIPVTCNIQMDVDLLGSLSTAARMSIWPE